MGGKRIACSESTQLQYLYSNEIEKMVEDIDVSEQA